MVEANPGWRPAHVVENRSVAKGSMWVTLEAADELPASYEPGHVLGLALQLSDGLLRHAYTVSRGEPQERRFAHLYRLISSGRMTPHLAALSPGSRVLFHGPFHKPIQEEVQSDARHIILVATGTGVGPLFGYAEKVLSSGESRPITLYAGFHEESHICLADDLDGLAQRYSNFVWHPSVTQPSASWQGWTGRVTECVPADIDKEDLHTFHFHLVGNGQMVHLMRKALHQAGIPAGRVSIETYFNHRFEPSSEEIEALAGRFRTAHRIAG